MKKVCFLFILLSDLSYAQIIYECSLWGTTYSGGAHNNGTIFKYNINQDTLYKTDDFSWYPKGAQPNNSLMLASDGNLYGTTQYGGNGYTGSSLTASAGTLFSVDTLTGIISKKHDCDYASNGPGSLPLGALIQATNGFLYGMTESGAANVGGAIFKYDPVNQSTSQEFNFNTLSGNGPNGSLLQASNGKLYGMATGNGALGFGTLFSYDIATSTFSKLLDFDNFNTGKSPIGSLIQASNGLLYGMLYGGGTNGCGVIFQFDIATNTFTKKADLPFMSSGTFPTGDLMQASNGKLYGMTPKGGANNYGTLFEYDIPSNMLTKKIDFSFSTGKYPQGTLMEASNGKLYGVTQLGGSYSGGTLFEYDINSGQLTKKADFNNATGMKPQRVKLLEICKPTGPPLTVNVPNIFTPNGDGINETWSIFVNYRELIRSAEVTIYNRWGERVFQTSDITEAWNGHTATGAVCDDGTYYFVVKYTDNKSKSFQSKGFLTLSR